jgi:pimeloyl-ACP methyl ester carboxylesterase
MRQDPESYGRTCAALAEAQSADVGSIAVPTLLVTGDEDGVAPAANVRALASRLRNVQVHVLDRCGHWTTFERPQECTDLLSEFLGRH